MIVDGGDLVLDSSCWIAWLDPTDNRADLVDDAADRHDGRVCVPSIVLFEIDRWLRRSSVTPDMRDGILARIRREQELPITHKIAIRAGAMSSAYGLATADALIAAAAAEHGCHLTTFDPDFANVPNVDVLGAA